MFSITLNITFLIKNKSTSDTFNILDELKLTYAKLKTLMVLALLDVELGLYVGIILVGKI